MSDADEAREENTEVIISTQEDQVEENAQDQDAPGKEKEEEEDADEQEDTLAKENEEEKDIAEESLDKEREEDLAGQDLEQAEVEKEDEEVNGKEFFKGSEQVEKEDEITVVEQLSVESERMRMEEDEIPVAGEWEIADENISIYGEDVMVPKSFIQPSTESAETEEYSPVQELESEEWEPGYYPNIGEMEGEPESFPSFRTTEKSEEVEATDDETSSSMTQIYSKLSPFFIKWAFGVETAVKLINLTKNNQFEVFYAASHFGILYDYRRNSMRFLPGHNSLISSIAADSTGRWLVTADGGDDNVIIIWDHDRRVPSWSLFDIFSGSGTRCVQISQDARFLVAVSNDTEQTCKFFLWTYGRDQEDGKIDLGSSHGIVTQIQFNHVDTTQFAITTETKVMFCQWMGEKKIIDTFLSAVKKNRSKIGILRDTLFLDDNHTAITSTSTGHVVVWSDAIYQDKESNQIQKKYIQAIRIHKTAITSLQLVDHTIVSSTESGVITFHDQSLSLLYCVPRYVFEPVVCVSCNLQEQRVGQIDPFSNDFDVVLSSKRYTSDEDIQDLIRDDDWSNDDVDVESDEGCKEVKLVESVKRGEKMAVPSDCTFEMKPFYMRDFIFLTRNGRFAYVSHHRTKVRYFLCKHETFILSIDCNPNMPHLAVGDSEGTIILYDINSKRVLVSSPVTNNGIKSLKYSPTGRYLTVGLPDGTIMFLDPISLTVRYRFQVSKGELVKICFSSDEKIFAFFDKQDTVYVYKLTGHGKRKKNWTFMGGYRSHYKPITDIMFDEEYDDEDEVRVPRLFTIGEDRMLVEYDMNNLQPGILKLKRIDRIEQTATPQCFITLPRFIKKVCFLVANNDYKFKVIHRNTRVCARTALGPTADTPLVYMKVIPNHEKEAKSAKMIYSTRRHIGLHIIPPTGNPFENMGMVGHPTEIIATAFSHDFKYFFTAGKSSFTILMWQLNTQSLDVAHELGGTGIEPFMPLIEDGAKGFLFREIQDFFYYAQIIHQGEHANLDRSVSKNLALCEVPDLVRSLGYFPSEYEISNMLYEISHQRYEETGEIVNEISFEDSVRLFLNYRPVKGITLHDVNNALMAIADLRDPECILIEKDELYKALEERAESMSHTEVVGYLCILLLPKNENDPLPPTMTLTAFADEVLGIDLTITEEDVREVTNPTKQKRSK